MDQLLQYKHLRIDGSTKNREAVVNSFQNEDDQGILLLSLKAAGVGLNLTAADHVYLMDPWWNPAVENQAADRTHRIGQTKPVMVYKLVSEETVEEKVLELQTAKKDLAQTIVEDRASSFQLKRDDILDLLN